jgi:hypothetical protein
MSETNPCLIVAVLSFFTGWLVCIVAERVGRWLADHGDGR